jgi:putative ATPase
MAARRPREEPAAALPDGDLFGAAEAPWSPPPRPAESSPDGVVRPLADRLRPRALEEVVGQDHLLGPEGALTRMLARGSLASLILWGPPGVGKTTIARLPAARRGSSSSPSPPSSPAPPT